jgi:hypothetical protein
MQKEDRRRYSMKLNPIHHISFMNLKKKRQNKEECKKPLICEEGDW